MNQAVKKFHEDFVLPTLNKQIQRLDEDYHQNKETYRKELAFYIEDFLNKYEKKSMVYLHLSWLRSSFFLTQKGVYSLEGFSEKGYYDFDKVETFIPFDWITTYLKEFCREIEAKQKAQPSFLSKTTIEELINRYFPLFQSYLKAIFPTYLTEHLRVRIGEYHGISEPLMPDKTSTYGTLEKIRQTPGDYMYTKIQGLTAINEFHPRIPLTKMRFIGVQLLKCQFPKSILVGSSFVNCELSGSNFSQAYLQDSSFEGSICHHCQFRHAQGSLAPATARLPSYHGVNFHRADLTGSDFRFARLRGADFTEALLTEAIFLEKQKNEVQLSARQVAAIHWISDEEVKHASL